MRKKASAFNLKRGHLHQSWSKYNLFNLSRYKESRDLRRNFFQQKWKAKAESRKYHGEAILEKHWKRQFNPTLRSVIPIDPEHLARSNGSEQASGRGSGLDTAGLRARIDEQKKSIPYTSMVYAALERRLDVAIHRAMFASSTRQARQFCIHGYVKVNGKQMIYPGYNLNPGDMFQVDPDRVLFATGAPKDAAERREGRKLKSQKKAESIPEVAEAESAEAAEAAEANPPTAESTREMLQSILETAKKTLQVEDGEANASRKRALRKLQRLVRKAISQGKQNRPLEEAVDEQMMELMKKLHVSERADPTPGVAVPEESNDVSEGGQEASSEETISQQWMSKEQKEELRKALQELKDNPIDPSKPYATPWRPRDYMRPFAFIPRYLEVHHKVCSAIYLRHPVARPGLAEVPSPFSTETSTLAFNWYLRNR